MPVIHQMKAHPGAAMLRCQRGNQLALYERQVGASGDDEHRKGRSGKRVLLYPRGYTYRLARRQPQSRCHAGPRLGSTATGTRKSGVRIVVAAFQPGYIVYQWIQAMRDAGGILLRIMRGIEA